MRTQLFRAVGFSTQSGVALTLPLRHYASQSSGKTPTVVDHYARLGVEDAATAADIKAAYRRRALQCHPDVVPENKKSLAEAEFRSVSESFQVLCDPELRASHDAALLQSGRRNKKQEMEKQKSRATRAKEAAARPVEPQQQQGQRVSIRKQQSTTSRHPQQQRRRTPFVRRDADRIFQEAFDGRNLQDILYNMEFQRRHGSKESPSSSSSRTPHSKHKKSEGGQQAAAGTDEVLSRVLHSAAEQFAANVSRQYGPESLKHAKFIRAKPASAPPSSQMSFRPFANWKVPAGVAVPETPTLGKLTTEEEEPIVAKEMPHGRRKSKDQLRKEEFDVMTREATLRLAQEEATRPHNLGQVYSFHRMY